MIQHYLITKLLEDIKHDRFERLQLNNEDEGKAIASLMQGSSLEKLDIEVYSNVSGQWLLWADYA